MECDEILIRAAEPGGCADDAVERHASGCASCRDAIEAARGGLAALASFERDDAARDVPLADARAAWRAFRRRSLRRVASGALRAAVLLLAATGALALAGVELRSRAAAAPALTPSDVDAAVETGLARLEARLDARDRTRVDELRDAAEWLDDRRRDDVATLVTEIASLRRQLAAVRLAQESMTEPAMPALPDPR